MKQIDDDHVSLHVTGVMSDEEDDVVDSDIESDEDVTESSGEGESSESEGESDEGQAHSPRGSKRGQPVQDSKDKYFAGRP